MDRQICSDAGVKLARLHPYPPNLNHMEEFLVKLKAFVRRYWQSYEDNPDQGFNGFLK